MKKSVFLSGLKSLYKKEEVDVADHLKTVEGDEIDDALVVTIYKQLDADKVTTFKTEATERFDNGVKKGQKDTAKKFEKKLREVFKVDEALEGDELLTHIEDNLPTPGEGGDGKIDLSKITEEDLLKVPAYINKERDYKKQLTDKDKEKEEAIKAEQDKITSNEILSDASTKALAILDGKNPILPKDPLKATTAKNRLLVDEIKSHKFMKGTDGSLIPLDAEGKQLKDANGLSVDFNGLVESIVDRNFEFNVSDKRDSPGNKNKQNSDTSKAYTGKAPANKKEYMELLVSDMDTDQKVALKETFSEQFSS